VPHSSGEEKLLHKAVATVCAECHDLQDEAAMKKHGGFVVAGSRCTGCHDPHVGKAKGLLRATGHAPATDGMCDACHERAPRLATPTLKKGKLALCADCHEFAKIQALPTAHQSVRDGECFACHSPHASPHPHLLSMPVPALCVDCHGDPDTSVTGHAGLTATSNCARCHAPHAPKPARLTAAPKRAPPPAPKKAPKRPAAPRKAPAAR
jgi:predicted CXXCH cytochrome family protein